MSVDKGTESSENDSKFKSMEGATLLGSPEYKDCYLGKVRDTKTDNFGQSLLKRSNSHSMAHSRMGQELQRSQKSQQEQPM